MKILFNDLLQNAAIPPEASAIKTAALADTYVFGDNPLQITFPETARINCIGIGNYSGRLLEINISNAHIIIDGSAANPDTLIDGGSPEPDTLILGGAAQEGIANYISLAYMEDGLYILDKEFETDFIEIASPPGSHIGRIGAGMYCDIPTAPPKEPCFNSTSEPRRTLSGQVVPGAGGYNFISLSLDSRYKINENAINEIKAGYKAIGAGFPFFISLARESYKLPFDKLYATETNQRKMSFESGVMFYLYSRRWNFEQAF